MWIKNIRVFLKYFVIIGGIKILGDVFPTGGKRASPAPWPNGRKDELYLQAREAVMYLVPQFSHLSNGNNDDDVCSPTLRGCCENQIRSE